MNDLTLTGGSAATMSSLEITDLLGSRHDSVRRTIERLAEKDVIGLPPLVEVSNSGAGPKTIMAYLFSGERGKRDSIIVVAQLSPEFTARLVDRWQELEQRQPAAPALLSRMDLIQLALAAENEAQAEREQRLLLEAKVEADAPKVAALDLLSASTGSMTFTQASKLLSMKVADMTRWMDAHRWIYRQNGSWLAYKEQIQNGRLEYKEANYTDQNTGMKCTKPYCHITPKGLAKLATVFGAVLNSAA